jgi:hypothetical protein
MVVEASGSPGGCQMRAVVSLGLAWVLLSACGGKADSAPSADPAQAGPSAGAPPAPTPPVPTPPTPPPPPEPEPAPAPDPEPAPAAVPWAPSPEAPAGDALVPGNTLTYRVSAWRSWTGDDGNPQTASVADVGTCRVVDPGKPALVGAVRVECSGAQAITDFQSVITAWPVWRQDGCYSRRDGALWFVPGCEAAPADWVVFGPAPAAPGFESRGVRALGRSVDARCAKPPVLTEEEQMGDDGGELGCFTPQHGLVTFETWFGGGMVEEGMAELLGVDGPGAAPAVDEAAARELLEKWVGAQNSGDFAGYSALFGADFQGVRRVGHKETPFDRAGWLADRQRMFKKPMKVGVSDVRVWAGADLTVVIFTQDFATGNFADRGPKQLELKSGEGGVAISREAMLASRVR